MPILHPVDVIPEYVYRPASSQGRSRMVSRVTDSTVIYHTIDPLTYELSEVGTRQTLANFMKWARSHGETYAAYVAREKEWEHKLYLERIAAVSMRIRGMQRYIKLHGDLRDATTELKALEDELRNLRLHPR